MKHFKNYEEFCDWVYEEKVVDRVIYYSYPRLKYEFKEGFILDTEPHIYYHRVIDCLHAYEEA